MNFKLGYLLIIFILFCSLTAVAAADLNQTSAIEQDDTYCLNEVNYEINDTLQSAENEDPVSQVENDIVLAEDSEDSVLSVNENEIALSDNDGQNNPLKSSNPLFGVVDFGSNTIKLEIFELKKSGKISSAFALEEPSVIISYTVDNKLTDEGINKLLDILDDFNDVMKLVGVEDKFIFATASLRKIDNADEVIAIVKEELGLDINLLEEEKEAVTSFNAVQKELTTDNGIAIDLGGGSCEVIDFVNKTPITMESMPIGSYSCYLDYVSGMFPNETETLLIQNRVLEELSKLEVNNSTKRYDLYGIAGTAKTIRNVLVYLNYIDDDTRSVPVSMLDSLLDEFKEETSENFKKILDVSSGRINTFVPGLIITKTIADYFNVSEIHFCKKAIRDGIAAELIENYTRKHSPDSGTFKELQEKIDNAPEGSTIYLLNNYTYDDSFTSSGITISKSVTIDGNGFTIDGLNKARIFNITAEDNIVLKNIRFINGFTDLYGAAIRFNSGIDHCEISGCIFENNSAEKGAAIYCGDVVYNSIVSDSTFSNNTAESGASIYIGYDIFNSNFTLLNFTNNFGDYGCGICFLGVNEYVLLNKINFIGNKGTRAPVLFIRNALLYSEMSQINLINNSGRTGGAISLGSESSYNTFSEIYCADNQAKDDGGAFHCLGMFCQNTLINSVFKNNFANNGGAIYGELLFADNVLENLTFENNSAGECGGAGYFYSDFGGNTLNNIDFINNRAINGSAFYFNSRSVLNELDNLNFINNVAEDSAAFYCSYVSEDIIKSCNFINNKAENVADICFNDVSFSSIEDSLFDGGNSIFIAYGSFVDLKNNKEINAYLNNYFVLNNGSLNLVNNSLRNVIYNNGIINTKTSVYVLDNKTVYVSYTPVRISAYCVDDNGNYIVSDSMIFNISGEIIPVSMGFNPIVSFNYDLVQNGTFLVNSTLSGKLSDCKYYIGIINMPKEIPYLNVSDIDIAPDEFVEIHFDLPDDAKGNITVELNNCTFTSSVNGSGVAVLPKLPSGDYSANVTYGGDEKYISKSAKINIHVKFIVADIVDMTRGWNSNYDYQVKLMDDKGNAIENKLIVFTIAGKQYYAMTDGRGIASVKPGLKVGNYRVTVSSALLDNNVTRDLKIVKRISNNKNIKTVYNSNKKYKVKIIGDNGKSESNGKSVRVIIDNKKYTYKTDKNGFITIKLNKKIAPGKHTVKIQYKGFTVSNKLVVKHALKSKKVVKVKKSAKKVVLKAKLKSTSKKAIKNKKIKFKIKGKTYTAKTNKKGIAKLTVKKNKFKKGKNPVKITYLKDVLKTSVKIK